jgi:hypothetical protein
MELMFCEFEEVTDRFASNHQKTYFFLLYLRLVFKFRWLEGKLSSHEKLISLIGPEFSYKF